MRMTAFGRLRSPLEARRRLLALVRPITRMETLSLTEAAGRICAETVRAVHAVPAFPRASWDGYAVRSRDLRGARKRAPVALRVVAELHAEEFYPGRLAPGEAVAIATGAPMPRGADAVVVFEETREKDGRVLAFGPVARGFAVVEPGEDMPRGERLAMPGEALTPARLGALGAGGRLRVRVYAQPRVAVVPNGNELVPTGKTPRRGQIREFNNITLGALLKLTGARVTTVPPVPDDPRQIEATLREVLRENDLVLATGGSSVGERDYLPQVFPRIGEMLFHGLSIRPGKPTLAARSNGKLLLGLPGHPTSCLSNAFWLVLPLLDRLGRRPRPSLRATTARLASAYGPLPRGFVTVLPVRLREGWATPTFRGSSAITSLVGAEGFALLPGRGRRIPRGERLPIWELPFPVG